MSLVTDSDKEVFGEVAAIWDGLRKVAWRESSFTPVKTLEDWLSQVTGCYMYLSTRYAEVSTARKNNEVAAYIQLKKDADVSGDKFVATVAEKQSRHGVSELAEAQHIFESYLNAADKGRLSVKELLDSVRAEFAKEER